MATACPSSVCFVRAARPLSIRHRRAARLSIQASDGYKFGDLSRKLINNAKEKLDSAGKDITGNEDYQFGDFSKRIIGDLREKAAEIDFQKLGNDAREAMMNYEFGSITKGVLSSDLGQQVLKSATEAGRRISGNPEYQFGDFTRQLSLQLSNAKTRADRLVALPDDVERLRQIILEQNLLIQSLTSESASKEQMDQLLLLEGTADELKPVVLDNQEVIDIVLSSQDEDK